MKEHNGNIDDEEGVGKGEDDNGEAFVLKCECSEDASNDNLSKGEECLLNASSMSKSISSFAIFI